MITHADLIDTRWRARGERREALIAAGAAGMHLASAWVEFFAALDALEAANRAAAPQPVVEAVK